MDTGDFLYRKLTEWDKNSVNGFRYYIQTKGVRGIAMELSKDEQIGDFCENISNNKQEDDSVTVTISCPNTDITDIIIGAIAEVCKCDNLKGTFAEIKMRGTIARYTFRFLWQS